MKRERDPGSEPERYPGLRRMNSDHTKDTIKQAQFRPRVCSVAPSVQSARWGHDKPSSALYVGDGVHAHHMPRYNQHM